MAISNQNYSHVLTYGRLKYLELITSHAFEIEIINEGAVHIDVNNISNFKNFIIPHIDYNCSESEISSIKGRLEYLFIFLDFLDSRLNQSIIEY